MREHLTGTLVGSIAARLRQRLELLRSAWSSHEGIGGMQNDHLALEFCVSLCPDASFFVDVGAHIGSVMGEVLRCRASVRVVAIEAIPEKAARLRRRFPRATVHECAVADQCGRATFFVDLAASGYSSLVSSDRPARSIDVKVSTLDTILPRENVGLMKVDVEGAELAVLQGADALVRRSRPVVIFESAPGPQPKEPLWRWFADRDYRVCVPNRVPHFDDGLTLDGFLESHLYPMRTMNFVAIPAEKRLEVRERARIALEMNSRLT